jgi:hypothetical protein
MAKQVQFRRGSNTENDTFTGAVGEITVDTTTNSLRVHDGTTAGGTALGSYTKPSAEPISYITGLQTALDGKIDDSQVLTDVPLGALFTDTIGLAVDGDGSQLTNLPVSSMGGTMTAHIIPDLDNGYDIGSAEYKIRDLYVSDNSLWVGDDHKDSTSGGKKKTKKRKQGKTPKKIVDAMVGAGKLFDTETELKNKFKVDIHDPAPDPILDPADPTFHPPIHKWLAFSVMNGQGGFLKASDIFDDDDDFDSENGIADVEGLQNALDAKEDADADISKTDVAETRTANIDLLTYTETTISTSGTINLALGTVFTHTHTGGMSSFTLSNVPTTGTSGFILILENGGAYPLTWWTGVVWPAATPPTLTAAGTDVFTFTTPDSGVTWYGIPSGIGMA